MKVLIVTSCTGEKEVSPKNQLLLTDFQQGAEHLATREQELTQYRMSAGKLYTGIQHKRLMAGVTAFREQSPDHEISLHILSAGYGLLSEKDLVVPYEVTFQGMKASELREWADILQVPAQIRELLTSSFDLGILLLGDDYLKACDLKADFPVGGPIIAFCGSKGKKIYDSIPGITPVVLSNKEAKRFSCGLVGLKGELTARLLSRLQEKQQTSLGSVLKTTDILSILNPAEESAINCTPSLKKRPAKFKANPAVDYVVDIPKEWWQKPHRKKMSYFIPEWDDLVDPDFDFENDVHSGGRGDWSNEVYAHQMYPYPNYDGILISKVIAEKSKKKKERINTLGVHRFLRVPQDFPIMGDCGAFGYIMDEKPPYTTDEILDYYSRLQFNFGVSLDHLIVTATEQQKQFRYDLTIHNADEFLKEHRKRGLPWEPIGAVQGWDPASYANAAKQCVAMGYKYIALGGLVRTQTSQVLEILHEVHKVVPSDVKMHLFGLSRLHALKEFTKLGVTSVDSASYLRRAWMGTGQNYLTTEGELYAAIRIPEPGASFRAKRIVSEGRCSEERIKHLEQSCLKAMKEFDSGKLSVEATLDILEEYDNLITQDRKSNRPLLQRTLEASPWKHCQCDICKKDGAQVIIFRGNNRNRRRGFHNIYTYYSLIERLFAGEDVHIGARKSQEKQLSLFPE